MSALARTILVRYNKIGGIIVEDRQRIRSWYRRFVIAAAVLCVAFVALLAAVVVIAPKVINSGEVRARIEATIAKELRGTVTYDRVELSLLPRPDVVLHGFAVDIPGTLSAAIAAVRVRAGLLSLFQGRFAISSIALERPELTLKVPDDTTAGRRARKPPVKKPAGESLDHALAVASRELPDLSITVSQGKIILLREGRSFLSLGNLGASLAFVTDSREGTATEIAGADYHITGTARATLSGTSELPAPLTVSIERFDATPASFMVKSVRTRLQDLDASISASFKDYLSRSPRSDISARGTIGPDALAWLQKLAGLPDGINLRAPLTVTAARLRSTGTGSNASRILTVSAGKKDETTISLALRQEPGMFSIDSLHVKDSDSDAVVKFSMGPGGLDLSFAGDLTGATIDRIVEGGRISSSWLKGDLRAQIPHGTWNDTAVNGSLEGGQLSLPLSREIPVTLDRFSILADGTTVIFKPVTLSLGQEVLEMSGTASLADGGVDLDLDVVTERFSWNTLRALVEQKPKERPVHRGTEASRAPTVNGTIRLRAAAFVLDRYQADAVDMRLRFGTGRTTVALDHASVCGITLTGSLRTGGGEVETSLSPQARGKKLDESLHCIFLKDLGASGAFDLSAQLAGRGTWDTLLRSMGGEFAFAASGGRFQNDHVVKGVIAYLNSTSLLKGSNDKLLKEGVPYETFVLRGTISDGTISLSEGAIRGRDLHIATEGRINLREGTLALNVLAAPFTRLDRMLGSVPLLKSLVGNALIVVPARVEGTFEHPSVKPLAASGVSKNVTNLMKNVVQAPMKIIDPVLPEERDRKNAPPLE